MRRAVTRLALAGVLLAVSVIAQEKKQQEIDLQAAIRTETVDGDLNGAIKQYGVIVTKYKNDRAVTAMALVHMAECYQKLGDAESRTIYEQVLREYADQKEAVPLARARLGGTDRAMSAKGDRAVWTGPNVVDPYGRVSPDGRFISYVDWNLTGNLLLHDIVSGTDRPLTGQKSWADWTGNAAGSTFSRDGKQVAYAWWTFDEKRGEKRDEIRIMNVQGTGVPQSRRLFVNEEIRNITPSDWSPDGKWLAVHVVRKDLSGQIGLVGVQDGSLRVLKSVDWRGPSKLFFSPDSKDVAYDLPASDTDSQRDIFVMAVDGSRETAAVVNSAQDVLMGWSPDGSYLLIASDRAGPMGLWVLPFSNGKPQGAPSLVKPDIGFVSSLGLSASGALHVLKDASTRSIQVAPIDLHAGKLLGAPVVQSFRSKRPDWSPDGKYLAYASKGPNGDNVLSIRSVESGHVRELRPKLVYLNEPRWSPDARSLVTFGTDLKGRKGIYQIDAQTGDTSFITPSDISRAQWSPDGKKIYYAVDFYSGDQKKPGKFIERDLASGETREVCRQLSGSGSLELSPDGLYLATIITQASVKTSTVLLIPVAGGEHRELLRVSLPESFVPFGAMTWTPDSRAVIVAKNREGGARVELWLVPVNDGQPRKLDVDVDTWSLDGVGGFRLHPNGNQIAFLAGKPSQEVWALENVLPTVKASR